MFLSPYDILSYLPVRPGQRVADFGVGNGEYAFLLSDKLQGEGSLYAFDVVPEIIERLHNERARKKIENFFSLCTDLNKHLPLKDRLIHCAVMANTLYAIEERNEFLKEVHRIMNDKGKVLFVDWVSSFNNMGPHTTQVITPGDAVRLFQASGFTVGPMLPAGSHHYAFVATKV